ncbi:S8 family serine peptidase, partial [uncultured Nocardioides sp.]|uniref:S8 family serine peptidase n=1 Tax=uncultured Nocardioides sp. TaxID=198441 RepID=UPI002624E624
MTRRHTKRLVMSTAVAATAACTALVTLPAYALISQTGPSVTSAASSVEPVVDPGPVLRPELTRHLRRVGSLEPVRVMVQADGDTAAARSAVRGAGMSVQTVLDRVGIVVAVGTPAQVRLLESAGASRVDWADRELETFSNTSHRATRGYDVHEGAIDLDGDGVGDELQGAGVSVAIVDSGVDGTHPMFDDGEGGSRVRRNIKMVCHDILEGFATGSECGVDNTLVGDTDTTAIGVHGTHVAGTIAQTTNNKYGVAGLAYNAKIMGLRVLNSRGFGQVADIADAVRFAADNGAQVINMSLGGPLPSLVLKKAIDHAHKKGVTVVAAAGNGGRRAPSYPAAY